MKIRLIILLAIFFMFNHPCFAQNVEVKILPAVKVTTSNRSLMEGDVARFTVSNDVYKGSKLLIKKGEKVEGVITKITPNDFYSIPATVYIENFKTKTVDGKQLKLTGFIDKSGNPHEMIMELITLVANVVRGGEVQIKPEKDVYTLFLGEKL